jgi:hypothetical protein
VPLAACPAGGLVDVITTLVPDQNTFSSAALGGIEVDVGYPASVSMPGSGILPVNDPTDPATLIVLLSTTPMNDDLYDGLVSFFDSDSPTAPPRALETLLTFNQTANVILSQPLALERARFTCTPGAALSATNFTCMVSSEEDRLGRVIPTDQRPACSIELSAPE